MTLTTTATHAAPSDATRRLRDIADLPGPKGLPLLGNILQIDSSKVHRVLEGWAAQYGPIYVFRMGREPVVAVSDPKLCDQILRDRPDGFTRSTKLARILGELGADGVFSAEGADWRQQRKLAVHALAQRNLRGQYEYLTRVARRLKARWDGLASAGAIIDITEEFKRFTVDATTLIAFDYDTNTIEQDGDVIQRKLELIFPMFNRRLFALVPWWRIARLPVDRRVDRALDEMRAWLGQLVAAARQRLADDPSRGEEPTNFLESMLVARDDHGRPYSDDVLFANLMTMLIAGEDTTAYTLAWAVHLLCENPTSVARLRAEADTALGAADLPADIDATNGLGWAAAIANETMRLQSVAPLIFVNARVDTVVGDLRVPQNTRLAVLGRPGARDATHFAEPSAFRPQRWLGDTPGAHDQRASIPFGSGPRICPGRSLALLEMKLILAMLYKNFEVSRVGTVADVREVFSFTLVAEGLKVRLRPRSAAHP